MALKNLKKIDKKLHDKRDDIAKKDQKREMDRASKGKYNY